MRYALILTAAALFAPSSVRAVDPPITFQSHPVDRVLNEIRAAAEIAGGQKAVKAFNEGIKKKLGEKGFEGLELSKPVVGYVNLAPKSEDITAVIAFPSTGEKEFLAFFERFTGKKLKDLGKGLWELPEPSDDKAKGLLKFANQYAYIAIGAKPESALDEKALVAPEKLYNPGEKGIVAGKFHFERLSADVKKAMLSLLQEGRKKLLEEIEKDDEKAAVAKPMFAELEKLAVRYLLLLEGADSATLRLVLDKQTAEAAVEATLTPKANSALAKEIAARKPSTNRFAALITPDTVGGITLSYPYFAEEARNAFILSMENSQKELGNLPIPQGAKPVLEELFKGQIRAIKAGEGDFAVALRGPDKGGFYTAVLAMSFDDSAPLEKAFKKYMKDDAPLDQFGEFKWDADKVGNVNIHTYKITFAGLPAEVSKFFGDEKFSIAFAFAPKGIYLAIGPDAITTIKDALAAKPMESPALDVVLNPAKIGKIVEKFGGEVLPVERAIGREDKLVSAGSIRVVSGKELSVRFVLNLRILPHALVMTGLEEDEK